MKILIVILFTWFNIAYTANVCWQCDSYREMESIENLLKDFEDTCEKNLFKELPLSHQYNPTDLYKKYSSLIEEVSAQIPRVWCLPSYRNSYYYYKLSEVKLDLIADYNYQQVYQFYMSPSWNQTLEEKNQQINQSRAWWAKGLSICKERLYENSFLTTNEFANLFEKCSKRHFHKSTHYNYALLAYLNNNWDKSIELLLKITEENGSIDADASLSETEIYQILGSSFIEIMEYDKAIEYLSKAIKKDPENKKAHFERAIAYFETGDFDNSLKDYQISDKGKEMFQLNFKASKNFTRALIKNMCIGAADSAIDFAPSLCNTAYGLGSTLWSTATKPVESTKCFANACYEMSESVLDYFKNVDWDTFDNYVEEIKTLYNQFDQLNDVEKGRLIGYAIGKYGTDIFAGGAVFKGIAACKKIKTANTLCNLEAMLLSTSDKEKILASSIKHAAERNAYFKNIRIHQDRQNKHVIGKHNFIPGGGEFMHHDSQGLLSKFAGKGKSANGKSPGDAGFRERIDFEEFIGYYVNRERNIKLPTNKGIVHYSKNGAHIVPSHPGEI